MRIDLTALTDVTEHPRVRAAQRGLADAEQQQADAEAKCAAAEADLRTAERAAASGGRDDKRLRQVREQVTQWQGEMRIAAHAVINARQAAEDAYNQTCMEAYDAFVAAHEAVIRRMDAALAEAERHSHDASALEELSARVFGGGWSRERPGRKLPTIAWTREFGVHGKPHQESRYRMWRRHCGVFNE